jgi:ADP-heptose:LPS heptosyltransferase
MLDAVKRRFPAAEIVLAGSCKSWGLFACDPRIRHLPVAYRKGTMQERLEPWRELRDALVEPDSLVIDPDSRLTQLGLLPVCPEDRYRFFESRGYGGAGDDPLPVLAARWVRETFGIEDARPFLAPGPPPFQSDIAVSFGVGENPAKRLPDPFEPELLRLLCSTGRGVVVDKGAGAEEAARVEAAIAGSAARTFEGSFASFAAIIQQSRLYAGYDSAGQHVAAACGVPLISIFAGFPAPRMFHRWRPTGPGSIDVVRVEQPDTAAVIERVRSVLLSTGLHSRR